jgi:hypothetical protein
MYRAGRWALHCHGCADTHATAVPPHVARPNLEPVHPSTRPPVTPPRNLRPIPPHSHSHILTARSIPSISAPQLPVSGRTLVLNRRTARCSMGGTYLPSQSNRARGQRGAMWARGPALLALALVALGSAAAQQCAVESTAALECDACRTGSGFKSLVNVGARGAGGGGGGRWQVHPPTPYVHGPARHFSCAVSPSCRAAVTLHSCVRRLCLRAAGGGTRSL